MDHSEAFPMHRTPKEEAGFEKGDGDAARNQCSASRRRKCTKYSTEPLTCGCCEPEPPRYSVNGHLLKCANE